ncbi:hypothetical protein [Spiroplasma endosymbiont of Panorpa germanica]|uniref:hypothetical protein n=1 Tax=Spiroplasma endosymbiont of Panorpa germanica TaxID=3066314 RepID=UPI0030D3D828
MAKITGNEVEFNTLELNLAWEKAISLENVDPNKIKMCYICKFHMLKENYYTDKTADILYWTVDLINTKQPELFQSDNLIAIHQGCLIFRKKPNAAKRIEKIRKVKWLYDEEFHQ